MLRLSCEYVCASYLFPMRQCPFTSKIPFCSLLEHPATSLHNQDPYHLQGSPLVCPSPCNVITHALQFLHQPSGHACTCKRHANIPPAGTKTSPLFLSSRTTPYKPRMAPARLHSPVCHRSTSPSSHEHARLAPVSSYCPKSGCTLPMQPNRRPVSLQLKVMTSHPSTHHLAPTHARLTAAWLIFLLLARQAKGASLLTFPFLS